MEPRSAEEVTTGEDTFEMGGLGTTMGFTSVPGSANGELGGGVAGKNEGDGLGCCGAATGTEPFENTGCKSGSIRWTRPPGRRRRAISRRKLG